MPSKEGRRISGEGLFTELPSKRIRRSSRASGHKEKKRRSCETASRILSRLPYNYSEPSPGYTSATTTMASEGSLYSRPATMPTARSIRAYRSNALETPSKLLCLRAVLSSLPSTRKTGTRLQYGSCCDLLGVSLCPLLVFVPRSTLLTTSRSLSLIVTI
jgi:hypothetical protein